MIRVTVWNEYVHEREYEGIAKVYPKGIHGCIADFLGVEDDITVTCATLDMENQGISEELLKIPTCLSGGATPVRRTSQMKM